MNSPWKKPGVSHLVLIFLIFATSQFGLARQNVTTVTEHADCKIDLNNPGQMADIISNALVRGLKKDSSKVSSFLAAAREKYASGKELALAAGDVFEIKEATLFAAIEDYKHCNCSHEGGEEHAQQLRAIEERQTETDGKISEFAENVLLHVILHEMGHGLVREFDLPILGNEETLADAFSTHFIVAHLPDRALQILEARISSLMIEAREVPQTQWTVKGEHNSDARRAYQTAALAIAYDPIQFASLAQLVDMNESDVRKAKDYGTEIHRSWRRILKPYRMEPGQISREASVRVDETSIYSDALSQSKLLADVETILPSFDWHSQVTVYFANGDGGAGWNRSKRTITVYDEYIQRFNVQGKLKSQ